MIETPWYSDPAMFAVGQLIGTPIGCGIALMIFKFLDRKASR